MVMRLVQKSGDGVSKPEALQIGYQDDFGMDVTLPGSVSS